MYWSGQIVCKVELHYVRTYILFIILFFSFSGIAGASKYSSSTVQFRSPIIVSYYGDYLGFKPGIHLGIERPVLVFRHKSDTTGNTFPETERSFLTSYNFIIYHHTGYNTSMQLFPSLVFRSVRLHGLILDLGIGTGVSRTFLDGPSYRIENSGTVKRVNAAGFWYWTASVAPSLGWDLHRCSRGFPFQIFLSPDVWLQYPYNKGLLFHFSAQAGVRTDFINILSKKVKIYTRREL